MNEKKKKNEWMERRKKWSKYGNMLITVGFGLGLYGS